MPTRSQIGKSDLLRLQDSINALFATFADIKASQDHLHDSFLAHFQLLQNKLQAQIATTTPIPSTETTKPPTLTLQLSDGSNPMKWVFQQESEPDSQQLTAQGGSISRVDGLASFSPIVVTDSPSERPHLSVVHLRPTLPRTPSDQYPLHKLTVTASIDPDSHPMPLPNPSDQMLHVVGTKIQTTGGAAMPPPPPEPPDAKTQGDDYVSLPAKSTNAGTFEDASIPDTGPYDSGPFNSPTPTTEVNLHRYASQGIISGSGGTVTDQDTVSLGTGLIDILCLRGQVDTASNLFDKMHKKGVASCKSIHSYGVRRGIWGMLNIMRFVIEMGLRKQLCCWMFPEISSVAHNSIVPISSCFVTAQDLIAGCTGPAEHYIPILHDKVAPCTCIPGFIGSSKYDVAMSIIASCDTNINAPQKHGHDGFLEFFGHNVDLLDYYERTLGAIADNVRIGQPLLGGKEVSAAFVSLKSRLGTKIALNIPEGFNPSYWIIADFLKNKMTSRLLSLV